MSIQIYEEVRDAKCKMLKQLAEDCRNNPRLMDQEDRKALFISTLLASVTILVSWDPGYQEALLLILATGKVTLKGQQEVDEFSELLSTI